jgi:hypothetical protein
VAASTGYEFDSPFFKSWVITHTLEDIGLIPEKMKLDRLYQAPPGKCSQRAGADGDVTKKY